MAARLLRFDAAELDADLDQASAHRTAASRRAVLLETELAKRFAADDPLASPLASALAVVKDIKSEDVSSVLASWAALPMPVLVVHGPRRLRRPGGKPAEQAGTPARSTDRDVAVVLACVDDQLIAGPQVLRPGHMYELRVEVRPGQWPEWADRLDAELVSHLTPQEAETPTFSWPRPAISHADEILIGRGTLILRFELGGGRPAPPFLVALRWHGLRDGQLITQTVDVAGHRELRLRPFDASRDFLTDFPVFDEHLLALYESLHSADYNEGQLQAFCRLFTAICRAGLKIMWDPRYKRGTIVKEKEFHDDLYRRAPRRTRARRTPGARIAARPRVPGRAA